MNPETNEELRHRVLDLDLSNEFHTSDEELAYARHLSDRELVDTQANRATWIAARTFYDAEASEGDAPEVGVDREAEQERRLHEIEEIIDTQGQRLDNLTYRLNEDRVKEMALSMAVQGSSGEKPSSIVEKAKAFEAFLSGSETTS